jgi:hypothetical protein
MILLKLRSLLAAAYNAARSLPFRTLLPNHIIISLQYSSDETTNAQ